MPLPSGIRRYLLPLALLAAVSGRASAQATEPAPGPPPLKRLEVSSDLSFILQTGNTELLTSGFGEKVIGRPGARWVVTEYSGFIYGKNGGTVKAESYRAGLNVEYAISPTYGTYTSIAYERNRFAGLADRFTYSAGLTAVLVDVPSDKVKFEVGLARINEEATTGLVARFFSGRIAGDYRHNFSPASYGHQLLEFLPNLNDQKDLRVSSTTEIVAPISAHVGLKASYLIRYDNEPAATFKDTDTIMQMGLQITF